MKNIFLPGLQNEYEEKKYLLNFKESNEKIDRFHWKFASKWGGRGSSCNIFKYIDETNGHKIK